MLQFQHIAYRTPKDLVGKFRTVRGFAAYLLATFFHSVCTKIFDTQEANSGDLTAYDLLSS